MGSTVAASGSDRKRTGQKTQTPGLFQRLVRFVREIVAELKKVVRPSSSEVATYTGTVLTFVAIIMAFVLVVDLGVGKLTFWVFGS